jgi:hypothetical protein
MAESLPDLVARLKATVPALADVPDDVLAAEVARQVQARGGPSVGDVVGTEPDEPIFRTSNEKDATGAAVVRAAPSPWTKAATIGAPGIGERYTLPSVGQVLASDQPLKLLAEYVTGPGRPRSVANADPTGIDAFTEGKGPMPMFLGTVAEEAGAGGRGLYSRVDDAVSRLPAKGAHPNKIAGILKSNASAEELAYRQVPEFLASKGNATVTPGELQAHLAAHPAPLPAVVTRGDPPADLIAARKAVENRAKVMQGAAFDDPTDWVGVDQRDRANAFWWAQEAARGEARALRKLQEVAVDPDHLDTLLAFGRLRNESTAIGDQIAQVPTTKYGLHTVPGGEAYQETLLTLPKERQWINGAPITAEDLATQAGRDAADRVGSYTDPVFRSSHFEEPNIVVHTRSNTRTLPTGERGRFVEEVQSDWHQAGKTKGYGPDLRHMAYYDVPNGGIVPIGYGKTEAAALADVDPKWHGLVDIKYKTEKLGEGVPDAPFKDTWPDLGLKQQLLEAAKDPDAQWLGFTSGQTQAARYDLSKQIDELKWYRDGDGYRISARKDGQIVAQQSAMSPQTLSATVGKEMAQKIVGQTEQHGVMSGIDLQVGGEGMHHFYDELLPKRLQKIVKPFGGTVERVPLGRSKAEIDAAMDALHNAPAWTNNLRDELNRLQTERNAAPDGPAWIVRLTPAMKARILKEGLPLGLLLGAAGPSVIEALGGDTTAPD